MNIRNEPYSRGYRIYVQRLVVRTLNDGGLVESFDVGAPAWRAAEPCIDAFGSAAECTDTFYRYTPEGWHRATGKECADCEYVRSYKGPLNQWPSPIPLEPDGAVAARAVACVRIVKS